MTPTEAVTAWEAANARVLAAKQELEAAEVSRRDAAVQLAEAIEAALPSRGIRRLLIGTRLVWIDWDRGTPSASVEPLTMIG